MGLLNIIGFVENNSGATFVSGLNDDRRIFPETLEGIAFASSPTHRFAKELRDVIDSCSQATKSRLLPVIPSDPKPGTFYLLPKIHKVNNPGRPIVSGINTLTENISGFIAELLTPVASNVQSFIQDTTHFLNMLNHLDNNVISDESLLVTMDVHSLYTNIPHDGGIDAAVKFYNSFYTVDDRIIPSDNVAKLIN